MKTILTMALEANVNYSRTASFAAFNVAEVFAKMIGFSGNTAEYCHAYELAVSEAFTNAVRYGSSAQEDSVVTINFIHEGRRLTVCVIDTNESFNPVTIAPDITSYPESGYGLFLIHSVMDSVSYKRDNGANILSMSTLAK